MRRETLPQPDRDRFRCGVAEAVDFVEEVVVEPRDERIDDVFQIGEVDQPPDTNIHRPPYAHLTSERMPMHAPAFVALRHIGQIMSGLEPEILNQLNDVRLNHLDRILLAGKN